MRSLFANALIVGAAMANANGEFSLSGTFGSESTDSGVHTEVKAASHCLLKSVTAIQKNSNRICGFELTFSNESAGCPTKVASTKNCVKSTTGAPNFTTLDVSEPTSASAWYKKSQIAAANLSIDAQAITGFSLTDKNGVEQKFGLTTGTAAETVKLDGSVVGVSFDDRLAAGTRRRLQAAKDIAHFDWVLFKPGTADPVQPATEPWTYSPWVYILPILAGLILLGLLIYCCCCNKKKEVKKPVPVPKPAKVGAKKESSEVELMTNALQIRPPVPEVVVDKLHVPEVHVAGAEVHVRQPEPRVHMNALSTVIAPPEPELNMGRAADQRIRVDPARVEVHAGKPRLLVEENDVHVRAPQHEVVVQAGSPMKITAPVQEVVIRATRHARVVVQEHDGRDETVIVQHQKVDSEKVIVKKSVAKEDSEKVLVKASDVSVTAKDGKAVTGQMALFKASNDVRGSHRYEDTSSSDE